MTDAENKKYCIQILKLCLACGLSIDKIAKSFNIHQDLVAKLFMETMQKILEDVKKNDKRRTETGSRKST